MDTEYILDCAAELGEITPLEALTLYKLPSAYQAVRSLVDGNLELPNHFLENTARESFLNHHPAIQNWLALESLRCLPEGLQCIAERASCLVQKRMQDELGITQPNNLNFLMGSSDKPLPVAITSGEDVTEDSVVAILEQEFAGFKQRIKYDIAAIELAVAWYRLDGGSKFREMRTNLDARHANFSKQQTIVALAQRRQQLKKQQSLRKRAHSAIKKATKLIAQFGQTDNLNLLISNKEVTLSHEASPLKFVLVPPASPGWLEDRSVDLRAHTPYSLKVLTKDDVFVSSLCVYFDKTPVLDQLFALSLFINSGEELSVLKKANWFGHNMDCKDMVLQHYPELENRYPKISSEEMRTRIFEIVHTKEERHWEPFKGRVEAWIGTWLHKLAASALELRNQDEVQPLLMARPPQEFLALQ